MNSQAPSQLASDWLNTMYAAGIDDKTPGVRDLSKYYSFFMRCAHQGDLKPVDELLKHTDVKRISISYMMALLRGNYRMHQRLPHWVCFRSRVRDELDSRGKDTTMIMVGLLEVTPDDNPSGALDGLMRVHPTLRG